MDNIRDAAERAKNWPTDYNQWLRGDDQEPFNHRPEQLPWEDASYVLEDGYFDQKSAPVIGHVYIFLDEDEKPIYVGKTVDFETRMKSHHRLTISPPVFRGSHGGEGAWEVAAHVKRIEVPVSELDSMERELIHSMHPKFNRVCKRGCRFYWDRRKDQEDAA